MKWVHQFINFKKIAVCFSIVAMGFLFQNCSSGGGSGGGSGSTGGGPGGGSNGQLPNGESVPPPASVNEEPAPPLTPVNCIEGFVGVPGNDFYGTTDFCVMKYEAKFDNGNLVSVPNGLPRDSLNRAQALTFCRVAQWDLITNDQWQTIARNIELVAENWSGGAVGIGALNRGHSDDTPGNSLEASEDDDEGCANTGEEQTCDTTGRSQKRTHIVSNRGQNEVIWDIAGNVWEWMKDNNGTWNEDTNSSTGGSNYGTLAYISVITTETHQALHSLSTDSGNGPARNAKNQFGPSRDYSNLNSGEYGGLGIFFFQALQAVCFAVAFGVIPTGPACSPLI